MSNLPKRRRLSAKRGMDHSYAMPNVNKHSNPLLKKIHNIYVNKSMNDITLVVGGVSYPAHRFLLCIFSDVFETMLMNSKWSDSHQEIIELQEDIQCIRVFPHFLQYFYSGGITLDHANVMPVLILADKYNVMDLTVLCVDYMCNHIAVAAEKGQLVMWFQYVFSLNQPAVINASYYCKLWQDMDIKPPWNKLLKACRNYIKWNLDSCTKCFNTFQCDILVGLLKQSDLVVLDEMQLFGYVVSWLNCQSSEKSLECDDDNTIEDYMSSLTKHVMSYIRYPMILPRQMAQLLMVSIVKQNKEFFVDKLASAMEYNTVQREGKSTTKYVLECTPRLYTCKRWGNTFRMYLKSIQIYEPVKRGLMTHSSLFDREEEPEKSHWEIQFFLKGICYDRSFLRTRQGSIVLPEVVSQSVRAAIKLKLRPEETEVSRLVRVAILVYAVQNKIVHVVTVAQKVVRFDSNQSLINIDNLMVLNNNIFDQLNTNTEEDFVNINSSNISYTMTSMGSLKFHVIISPVIPSLTDIHVGTRIQHVHF